MELVKDYKTLIENLVKASPKYSGNEDLFEDFCAETYKKSYLILQSVENENSINIYLKKVVSSAIMDVLKNNGRVVRSTDGYRSVDIINFGKSEIAQEDNYIEVKPIDSLIDTNENSEAENADNIDNKYLDANIPPLISNDLMNVKDPKDNIEDQIIRKDIIENIIDIVKQLDSQRPEEMYAKIFYMRYFLHQKQTDIAQSVCLSQAEISKRLMALYTLIKEKLYY